MYDERLIELDRIPKEDYGSFGLSQEDAQVTDQWRMKIKEATG